MPFKALGRPASPTSEMTLAGELLSIFGGGFSLCVQAALVACDAGAVSVGERIVVASADTAVVLLATRTETFLSRHVGLLVQEFVCRPAVFDISKPGHSYVETMRTAPSANAELPAGPTDAADDSLGEDWDEGDSDEVPA